MSQPQEIITVGVVGYSDLHDDQKTEAQEFLETTLKAITDRYPNVPKELIAGLTDYGVPALAYSIVTEINKTRGEVWRTVGIAPEIAQDMRQFPVDEKVIAGEKWGEDSPTFKDRVKHILIRVGGGRQARHETEELREAGVEIIEHELPIKEESRARWGKKKDSILSD